MKLYTEKPSSWRRVAVSLGKLGRKKICIRENIVTEALRTYKSSGSNRAIAFLLVSEKKSKVVGEIFRLRTNSGCRDTPSISSNALANSVFGYAAMGKKVIGILIVREEIGSCYNDADDSLYFNLKSWQNVFPKSFVVAFDKKNYMVGWYLERKKIEKVKIELRKEVKGKWRRQSR
jgi:hypothetical protein